MRGFPPNHVFLNKPVVSVVNEGPDKVRLGFKDRSSETYDHVIIATHGDQALKLIKEGSDAKEISIMSGFQTSKNTAFLHSDLTLMPVRRRAWSSWNYITKSSDIASNIDQVCLTYNMNILQHIPTSVFGDVLVTLNPLHPPRPDLIQGKYNYSHPLYTRQAIESQNLLSQIQNKRGISYAGAWTKYGFHEDGFSSGLKVAIDHLGAKLPFDFMDSTFSRGKRPELSMRDLFLRLLILITQLFILIFGRLYTILKHHTKSKIISKHPIKHKKTI